MMETSLFLSALGKKPIDKMRWPPAQMVADIMCRASIHLYI